MARTLLWFRRDLRLRDHPALRAAHRHADGNPVVALFVVDPGLWAQAGSARQHWLAESLGALHTASDGALVIRWGNPAEVVPAVAGETGAVAVHATGAATPAGVRRETAVRAALAAEGRALHVSGTPYALAPGTLTTTQGTPYRVFAPFARAWRARADDPPVEQPRDLRWRRGVDSAPLPQPQGARPAMPAAGEAAARQRWEHFLDTALADYAHQRDRPDRDGTSQLSAALHFGEIHPRTLLAEIAGRPDAAGDGARTFVTELAWREFYADVLHHHPASAWQDLTPALRRLPYDDPGPQFEAWRQGRTGYPFVDAGMRQLLAEGWMHNRTRMVTASFLTKDLHLWWPLGARHFLTHLRDGDLASNSHGWQWVAGTGTDAAPYFRIFNPVTQGRRFDPDGDYVRRYVPELAHLPGATVHEPWKVVGGLDRGYPTRIVDHADERAEALARYAAAR